MEKKVTHALLKTFAFFDLFAYPLTSYEAWKWLISEVPVPLPTLLDHLNDLTTNRLLTHHKGFYCLPGNQARIPKRRTRFRQAERKWEHALRASRWLARFPFVRMIAISNTLAYSNADDASDIDFFIVTEQEHIWTSRFFSASYFHLRGQRPTPRHSANTICLSFWVTEENLNLQPIAIDDHDVYLWYWIAQAVPVYDPDQLYHDFWKTNRPLLRWLPHIQPTQPHQRRRITLDAPSHTFRRATEVLLADGRGAWAERQLKTFQLRRLPSVLKKQMNQNKGVVVQDHMLKFHDHDRRKELQQRWLAQAHALVQSYEASAPTPQSAPAR